MLKEINTIENVNLFAYQLVYDEDLSFHPDDDFKDYINLETKVPLYPAEECKQLNQLMSNCFSICQQDENVFFEDSIAKCILFKTAEKRYGIKPDSIGEMRQVVVPYTISLLNQLTKNQLDIYKIWKNQQVSPELSDFIYELMKQVNQFILEKSPVSHYIEWAKKEECWDKVKGNSWNVDISEIQADLIDIKNPPKRNVIEETEDSVASANHEEEIIRSIPFALWKKIESWGKDTDRLSINQQSTAFNTAFKVKNNQKFSDSERSKAMAIFEIVCEHNIDLLSEADALAEPAKEEVYIEEQTNTDLGITVELIQKMADWDKRRRILKDWQWKVFERSSFWQTEVG